MNKAEEDKLVVDALYRRAAALNTTVEPLFSAYPPINVKAAMIFLKYGQKSERSQKETKMRIVEVTEEEYEILFDLLFRETMDMRNALNDPKQHENMHPWLMRRQALLAGIYLRHKDKPSVDGESDG